MQTATNPAAAVTPEQLRALVDQRVDAKLSDLAAKADALPALVGRMDVLHQYVGVFLVAFLVTILAVPLVRRLAIANGIVDRPDETRKMHKFPIAYMGGVGVYLGLMAGVLFSYTWPWHGLLQTHVTTHLTEDGFAFRVPISVLGGMTIIMLVGLLDDVLNISPWQKIGGQLLAAAFLAMEDVGVRVAYQIVYPIATWVGGATDPANQTWILFSVPYLGPFDVVYWSGTAIIAVFVLGACNASNLIDGLDGLLSGVTAIAAIGLLIVGLGLAVADAGRFDSARVIMCLALLGACMGFLPHNFNPAVIFLGDAGSLLLGYVTIVIVLTLGDQGRTDLVIAGLVIYAIPVIDTILAIVRRKLTGKSIADADDQHLHHMFKRALGVKGAVLTLYLIGFGFAGLGVWLATSRARVTYALAMVFALFIGVMAIKVARRKAFEEQMLAKYGPAQPGAGGAGAAAAGASVADGAEAGGNRAIEGMTGTVGAVKVG